MDRKALLIYLKDLRDLELAKIKLSSIIQKEKYETENYLKRLITPDIQSIPERDYSWIGSVIGGIFVLILSISCFFLVMTKVVIEQQLYHIWRTII